MPRSLHPGSVFPRGLVVDHVGGRSSLTIAARLIAALARCPSCYQPSSRIHSRYTRGLSDLPVAGSRVVIDVRVRRFRCTVTNCRTKIFAERAACNGSMTKEPRSTSRGAKGKGVSQSRCASTAHRLRGSVHVEGSRALKSSTRAF